MFTNYFKIAWRNLIRNKRYTAINIVGLGIAIAACLLIGLFVNNEISFDNSVTNKAEIYRLNEYIHYNGTPPQLSAAIGSPIASYLTDNHPEIKSYTRILPATPFIYPSTILEYNGKKIRTGKLACTDTSFADMFNVSIIDGDRSNFVRNPNSIVLTKTLAEKIFGNTSAVNKTLLMHTTDSTFIYITVSNVMADFPQTSHLQVEGLLPMPKEITGGLEDNYGALLGPAYLKLQRGVDITSLQNKLTQTIHAKNKFIDMRLQPLEEVHTQSTDINYDYFNYNKIDDKYITIFIVIGLAIFIVACINFINLTIAIAGYRGKEIAIKKIIGAKRFHIILQVLTETFISVLMALLLSVVLTILFLPYLNQILNRQLTISSLYETKLIFIYAVILLTITLLAGIYPAWLISSFKINRVLRNKILFGGSRITLRNILVTGQFAIAIVFIVSLIVFISQLRYLQNKNLGYSYSQVIKVPLDAQSAGKLPVLRSGLSKIKGVTDVTYGFMDLGGNGSLFGVNYIAPDGENKQISVNFENVATNYISFFGMKIVSGRDFGKNNSANEYLINETLAQQIGYSNAIGKQINLTSFPPGTIVGVVKNFNYSSLHTKIEPLLISAIDYVPVWQNQLYIKITTAHVSNTVKEVESTLKSVSGNPDIFFEFLDQHFKEVYQSERQAGTMIAIITGLAVGIACLGLLSLTTFVVLRRTKEIGIRKVLGASVMNIIESISKEFIRLIILAFVIASPIAWYVMNQWLQDFAYRISISWWMFALAGAAIVFIALVTISFQAIKAAIANPVKSLRTE